MRQLRIHLKRSLACAASLLLYCGAPSAQVTDISSEPLAQPASSVKPNIMLILDDSGSMESQFTPDYITDDLCFDSGDDGSGDIDGGLDRCRPGDPPYMSPDVNTQYYNPEIRYFPAVNSDGTSRTNMDSANTTGWTAVPTDNVTLSSTNTFRVDTLGSSATTADLVSDYPDRVWCTSTSDSATGSNCKTNSAYTYPDATYSRGETSFGNIKYKTGAPYYYRLATTEYCDNSSLASTSSDSPPRCISATAPTGTYVFPAPVRYCTDSTLTDCQAKRMGSYDYPKFVGNTFTGSGAGGQVATATISVRTQSDAEAGTITGLFINGVNVISGNISLAAGFSRSDAATAIRDAINASTATSGYHATLGSSGRSVTVRYGPNTTATPTPTVSGDPAASTGTPGADPNGFIITPTFNVTATQSATATLTIGDTDPKNYIYSIEVGGVELLSSTVVCPNPAIAACPKNSHSTANAYMASQVAAAITAGGSGFTATASGSTVTITAPAGSGSSMNGVDFDTDDSGLDISRTDFSGGTSTGDVELSTTAFSGGAGACGSSACRDKVGNFSRIDIVPFRDAADTIPSTFMKYPNRTDCAGASCTYDEEMTNFANWYAYYRTRMHMAKTAIGRSFSGLNDSFRVGFITINPMGNLTDRFLAIDDFTQGTGNQRDNWYTKLYEQSTHGSTPLREALSRVGRYYGNVTDGINSGMSASPIQVSCQPSFSILTTDGYWNGEVGRTLSDSSTGFNGSGLGNYDNVDSGFSKRSEARYDGGNSGTSGTLADVALYYYKTDLRSDLDDQVPVTARDPAAHQHMTTFTVGLGLAGQLNYSPDYESGGSADFELLKISPASGGLDWPRPSSNSETALDDLWHAAVNGRGTFFSAKDPTELTNSLIETLSSVTARIGAGAAAATSNLQPVAGDNFAFTAQYQTVDWIGDLKAKTIDLDDGSVSFAELWSAAALLDQRTGDTRHIYTFDSSDTAATSPQNGNRLKSFCSPDNVVGGAVPYTGCDEASGLSTTEMSYFEPVTGGPSGWTPLSQSTTWASDSSGRDTAATKEKVVDYLRGDTSNEILNTVTPTTADLFRKRTSLLGDIINAQPAYVKASPFGYGTADPYYADFKNSTNGVNGTRKGTVYAAANDGMLHAFETDPDNSPYFQTAGISTVQTTDDTFTGTLDTDPSAGEGSERWAYIPSMLLPNLLRLADSPYTHRYYTDGSPVVGDVCFGHSTATPCSSKDNWHTILVAGLNAGGRGYYALDVTDPANPKGLWEFKGGSGTTCIASDSAVDGTQTEDCNLGFSFGNPLVVKLPSTYKASDGSATDAGKWVVIVTSGYNNVNPGDGSGHLYILDAQTGKVLQRYTTAIGCDGVSGTLPCTAGTADPVGLGRINAWVNNAFFDNTALTLYAGDLKGNVWRIQLADTTDVPASSVSRLATVTDPSGSGQPITTKPELGEVSGKRVVFVATGKFLGASDKTTSQRQSVYAIKDNMTSATDPVVTMTRSGTFPTSTIGGFVRQDLTLVSGSTTERTTTENSVDFTDPLVNGWFIDLPDGGTSGVGTERANVDPILQLGTLVVPSNVPSGDTCVAGGFGWVNFLDYRTGGFIAGSTDNVASVKISTSLVVGINVVQLPGSTVKTIVTTADNQQLTKNTPVAPSGLQGKRVSWRELFLQ